MELLDEADAPEQGSAYTNALCTDSIHHALCVLDTHCHIAGIVQSRR